LNFNSELFDEVPTVFAWQTSIFRGGIMVASVDRAFEVVDQALPKVYDLLKAFATREDFLDQVAIAFGNNFDPETLEALRQQWANGDSEDFPKIEVRSAEELNGANGAFAAATNTIYLSRDYLERNESNLSAVRNILLEEYGHFVDAQINQVDTVGNEGEIFSAILLNQLLSEVKLQALFKERDFSTIELDAKKIQVEQSAADSTSAIDFRKYAIDTEAYRNFAGDEGKYYDPSNQVPTVPGGWKWEQPTLEAPKLSQAEVRNIETGVRLELLKLLTEKKLGNQTKDLIQLYLDSSPTYHINLHDKKSWPTFRDGSEIADGFSRPTIFSSFISTRTQRFVNQVLGIIKDKITNELKTNSQSESYTLNENLIPAYYLNPNYNGDSHLLKTTTWRDRDGHVVELPEGYQGLDYFKFPDLFNAGIPDLIAGGIGYGGNAEIKTSDGNGKETIIPQDLIPDTRKLEGTIGLKKVGDYIYQLDPHLKITIEDTFDFSPGNQGGLIAQLIGTENLWKLETNGGAYDVPFIVEFTPHIKDQSKEIDITPLNWKNFWGKAKDIFHEIDFSIIADVYKANNLDNYGNASNPISLSKTSSSSNNFNGLPFFGDALSKTLEASFVNDLYIKIENSLNNYFGTVEETTVQDLQKAFYSILSSETGLGLLKDTDQDGVVTEDDIVYTHSGSKIQFNFDLGGRNTFDVSLPNQIGLPQLGLKLNDNTKAGVNLDYDFNLGFGIDTATNQFFFDTSPQKDISISLTPSLPKTTATLGFLQVDAKNIGSQLNFDINLDDGNDHQLTLDELNKLTFDTIGSADIKLNLATSINGSLGLPSISTDLNLSWLFDNSNKAPTVAFNNVQLDVGSFFSNVARPILKNVKTVTEPIEDLTNLLANKIDLGVAQISLLDALRASGKIDSKDENFIKAIADISKQINNIPTSSGIKLQLGSFTLDARSDIRKPDFQLNTSIPKPIGSIPSIESQLSSGNNGEGKFLFNINNTPGGGLNFPILTKPETAFNLLLGKDVNLFTYTMPTLEFGFNGTLLSFPIIPPFLDAKLKGGISARIGTANSGLNFGYDTYGLRQFAQDNFQDANKLANGFFITDLPGREAELSATLEAAAELGAVVASASAGGDITGTIGIDLNGGSDGKVRLVDFDHPQKVFSLSGEVTAGLSASIKFLFSKRHRVRTPRFTLWPTNGSNNGGEESKKQAVLATGPDSSGILRLNIGLDAGKRQKVTDKKDGDEVFTVEHLSGLANDETVSITAFSANQQKAKIRKIIANAGQGNDTIEFSNNVLAIAELLGGNGDDQLTGGEASDALEGDSGNDILDGSGGNDTLRGNQDDDVLIGGAGADVLDGGSGFDAASYETATSKVSINLETKTFTGDAAGDTLIAIEEIDGSKYNDTIVGNSDANTLDGLEGNDSLSSGSGNDFLVGGAGGDRLDGGDGIDTASYAISKEGVSINLQDDTASSGDAQGDVLLSIENLEGSGENDVLVGNSADNTLSGLNGNDNLSGGSGDDALIGGLGADILRGDSGNDTASYATSEQGVFADLQKGEGKSGEIEVSVFQKLPLTRQRLVSKLEIYEKNLAAVKLAYSLIPFTIITTQALVDTFESIENLEGSVYNDALVGNDGNNYLSGLEGNDKLDGGGGDDTLVGSEGSNTLNGGIGTDTASYKDVPVGTKIVGQPITKITVSANLATGEGIVTQSTFGFKKTISRDKFNNIENLEGSRNTDTLIGNSVDNDLNGLGGDDILDGKDGSFDRIFGDTGNDTIVDRDGVEGAHGGEGNDRIDVTFDSKWISRNRQYRSDGKITGGYGNDVITVIMNQHDFFINLKGDEPVSGTSNDGNDTVTLKGVYANAVVDLGGGDDTFNGGIGNDNISGGNGNELLLGYKGNDKLDGQGGYFDRMFGGEGNDTLVDSDGVNGANGNEGNDAINITFTSDWLSPSGQHRSDGKITGGYGNDVITVSMNQSDFFINLKGDEPVSSIPNDGDDIVNLQGIYANSIADLGGGNDTFNGGVGNDNATGGKGNDILKGGDGNDFLSGGYGDDILDGGYGFDTLNGGAGIDTVDYSFYGSGVVADLVNGVVSFPDNSTRTDTLLSIENAIGSHGNDTLTGNADKNTLNGNSGNDLLRGGFGNDTLLGNVGDDSLAGDQGDDILIGGDGNDALTGSSGADHFVFDSSDRSQFSSIGNDIITDFSNLDNDKIILVKGMFKAIKSFVGIGFSKTSEFAIVSSNIAAQTSNALIVYNSLSGALFYNQNGQASGFGNGTQFATLTGNPFLTASSFIIQA
jgi:Ca2+-binding RTX toxin-like protein